MSRMNSSSKAKRYRRSTANLNQTELVELISTINDLEFKQTVANKLVDLNRKHRLKMPKSLQAQICHKCSIITNSSNTRVRVKNGMIIKTCLACNHIRRYGKGPKFNRGN
ncbi:MAG: hypothetical protein ISP82_07500 [Candidatus Poseidoniaceae archaeon]|nr:hypothetical protein [Candidatus Poseidoniaceae archaeon]MBL6896195.1 hypothetical protein [Candidatus Poseidoniaceae archaeon]